MLLNNILSVWQESGIIWWVILSITNGVFLFSLYVDWRQYKQISKPKRPAELVPLCSEEEYQKSREYMIDNARFGLISDLIDHFISLSILFSPLISIIWRYSDLLLSSCPSWVPRGEISQSLIFVWLLYIIGTVKSLPFSIYKTFVLEKRHDFNKTTPWIFTTDLIKMILLTAVIGGPILAASLWIIMKTKNYFVISIGLFTLLVQFLMILIYPTVIQPLFNKFTPLEEGELKSKIEGLAKRVSFPLTKIFVIDGSKRSSHSNAYFIGFRNNKRIVIYDTLIQQMTSNEILAVVGHEIGHWWHNHMLHSLLLSQITVSITFYLFSLVISHQPLYSAFGFHGIKPIIIGLYLFSNLLTPLNVIIGLFMSFMSRKREFEADRYATELGFGPDLQSGLIKLYAKNKSLVHPDWLYSMLYHSHPPPTERIAAMQQLSKKQK